MSQRTFPRGAVVGVRNPRRGGLALVVLLTVLGGPTAALAGEPGSPAADPTLAVFELYYHQKDFSKTPEYASKVNDSIIKQGGFDVVNRADAERPVRERFPITQEMKIAEEADEIQKMVASAEADFFNIGPDAALDKLRRAQEKLQKIVDSRTLTEELKKQYLSTQTLLALVYLQSDSRDKAEEVMRRVVRQVGQEPTINEDNYHPDVVALYRETYRSLSEQRVGKITVRSTPPGADTYINGLKQQRKTPATYEGLFPGEVIVQVRKGDKASRIRKVLIGEGDGEEFNIDLNFEASLAFQGGRFGLQFLSGQDRTRYIAKFGAALGEIVDADYVAFVGLGESKEGESQLEGYLVEVASEKLIRERALPTRANVVAKRRVGQMAQVILYGKSPEPVYKPWYENTVGWVLTGVGVVGGGLGGLFYSNFTSEQEVATCNPGNDLAASGCKDQRDREDAKDAAETNRTLAYTMWGIGSASLIAGVLVFILVHDEDLDADVKPVLKGTEEPTSYLTPLVMPDGGMGVGARISF